MRHRIPLSAVLAAFVIGCGSDGGVAPGGNGAPITQAEAAAITEEMRGELTAITEGASVSGLLVPGFFLAPDAERILGGPVILMPRGTDCPTPSENPPTDTDGDGVPDNLTLTFDPALCTFTNLRGNVTHVLSGAVTISDPSAEDRGVRLEWSDLEARTTIDGTIFFARRIDGVWQQIKSATGFSLTDQTTVTHESSERPPAQLVKDWQVDFVADEGATFSHHWRLPSGTLTVNGSTERTRGTTTRSFSVETVVPLHFDAGCPERPRIDAGELNIVHTRPEGTTTINIVFPGCGEDPIITLS
jgi:hypothetical protein